MIILSIILLSYLGYNVFKHGIPNMISDTYYQMEKYGYVFSIVLLLMSFGITYFTLSSGLGVQCLAFLGGAGLAFVAVAPNYLDKDNYKIHKIGAIVAACGSIGWSLSVNIQISLIIMFLYTLNQIFLYYKNRKSHPWYWAELMAFIDIFITYLYAV